MRLRGAGVAFGSVAAFVAALSAQTPPRTQFRAERPIVSTAGPHRLRVDVPLLVGSRPLTINGNDQSVGLNDLRLYDAAGVEVPHLQVWPPAPSFTASLDVERRPSEPGRSRYRLRLPAARLPIVGLDLDVDGDYVLRSATVTESRLGAGEVTPFVIGTMMLRRDARSDASRAPLRISIGAPAEPEVELAIEDGDNPPLNLKSVSAVFAELPWIYFEGDGGALVARYGDPALTAPHYDLEATRLSIHIENVPEATWGEARSLTPSEPAPAAAAMPIGGAPIDPAMFGYTRAIPPGNAGLIAVPLDAAAMAHSAGPGGRFADVRVTDANKQQVPYVLERRDEPLVLEMSIESREAPRGRGNAAGSGLTSYYHVRLPFAGLPSPRLVLATTPRVFDRNVGVAIERPADERHRDTWVEPIVSARWTHADRDTPAPALTLQLPTTDVTDLLLTIGEGDNTALPIASAQLLLPSYRIRLFRNGGVMLRMAYGHKDSAPPAYDLALLAPQLLGVPAREVTLAAEESGPSLQTSTAVAVLLSPRLFWGVLIVAVVALLVLLARLLKREPPAGS